MKVIKGRWVLKLKPPLKSNPKPIYKARWVAKGFQQRYGLDFNETFANTTKSTTWRLIIALGAYLDWEIRQWDIKLAYPNANLTEKVYIEQPKGFINKEHPEYVCELKKALYGLKQSAREWQNHLKGLLSGFKLYPIKSDQSIYINSDLLLIIIAYVDDIIAIAPKIAIINDLFDYLSKKVDIRDLGEISTFLGIEFLRNRQNRSIFMHQKTYTEKVLAKFAKNSKTTPKIPIPTGIKVEPFTEIASKEAILDYQ